MTNHAEEQAMELEALESLFAPEDEFVRVSDTEILLHLRPCAAGEGENHVGISLRVYYTDAYPDEAPDWKLEELKGFDLSDELMGKIRDVVSESIESSLGMAMVYTVASAVQELLKENNQRQLSMHEEMMLRQKQEARGAEDGEACEDDEDDDEEQEEEPEWKGLALKEVVPEDKRITPESFAEWKKKFDVEMIAEGIIRDPSSSEGGVTGRKFFLDQKESGQEVKEPEEGALEINEELFEGEDDVDLDDDEDA